MGTPRYACLKCDKLLPVGAEECPFCGAKAKHSMKANIRGAALYAKQAGEESRKEWEEKHPAPKKPVKDEPVSAVLLTTTEQYGKSAVGTAARGLVGGALFGAFGAAVGMSTAKTKVVGKTATFSVKYASGRVATETVQMGTLRFEELAALIHHEGGEVDD